MIKSNPHTHTCFVDGKNTAGEMVESALCLGFDALGFSEHAAQPEIDSKYGLSLENRKEYIAEIDRRKAEYAGRIRIYRGYEIDRVSSETGEGAEYFYCANHYFTSDDGSFAAVDGDKDKLEQYVSRFFGGCWDKALAVYFDEYAAFVEAKKPDIIAHLDLICKTNRDKPWFEEGSALIRRGKEAMERMIKVCDLLEVNTGGMVRSNQPCPYPVMPLLKFWKQIGGRVIPASDCHRAHQLGADFDAAEDYMRAAGFTEYTRLGPGDEMFITEKL